VRQAGLEPRLVVLTPWPYEPSQLELSNRETIERLGGVKVSVIPPLDLRSPASWPVLPLPDREDRLRVAA